MKDIIYRISVLMLLAAVFVPSVAAQEHRIGDIVILGPSIDKDGELVTVKFTAEIGRTAVGRNYSIVCGPELTDGVFVWSLPAIIIQGKRSKVLLERQILASDNAGKFEEAIFTKNASTVEYVASVPYQEWMEGASLSINAIKAGCCSYSKLASEVMAEELVLQPKPEPEVKEVYIKEVVSTGEKLAQSYPFVLPAVNFETVAPGQLFNEDRENTIKVHYQQGKYNIMRDYRSNRQSLVDLMASIRILENSVDSRVGAIVIAGFASPEGDFEFNDRLAFNRAVSVKEYIMQNSGIPAEKIKIYNGSVDWQGLRMLVEASTMPWRDRVLDIIDNVPVWDAKKKIGRHGELMRLDGGGPYRYMLANMFPDLRNSAYIRVYYEDRTDGQAANDN